MFSLTDSEKSFSPSADETQPFAVPFESWSNSYSGSEMRQLVQQNFNHHHPSLSYYGERMIGPSLFGERGSSKSIYANYESTSNLFDRPPATTGLYVDREIHRPEMKTDTAGLCTRLILNGAFKCIKCSKVTALNFTLYYFTRWRNIQACRLSKGPLGICDVLQYILQIPQVIFCVCWANDLILHRRCSPLHMV